MLRTCSKHRWRNELLPQLRPACWQKSAVEAGTQRSQPTTHHSSAASLFLVPLNLFCPFPPPLLLGGDQVIKHRLQRLLRPQKEERRSRPQSSTVATVGLEEMKSKVCSNCTLLVHASCACFSTRSQRISLGQQDF